MKKKLRFTETRTEGRIATIMLDRPEVHNAFNAGMIAELTYVMNQFSDDEHTDVLILRGNGKSFSSGADLNYMKEQSYMTEKENQEDALKLAGLFHSVYACRKVVISLVHGHVAGGANGLVAASDFAIASDSAIFRFSEVRLGLVPASISPYVIERVGLAKAKEMMLSGKAYSAEEALKSGLINQSCRAEFLDEVLDLTTREILKGSPSALRNTKQMINSMRSMMTSNDWTTYTSRILAGARSSDEGREGISAFLEKRRPFWLLENE